MPQKNAQDRLWKILTPVLLVLAVLAMAKTLFVGLEIDEEYAFSLGFRLVKGDRLFYTMWEPHQLSALPAALVLALYTAIAGTTTGALLFVRAVVLVCKAAMSAVFYREFKQTLGRHGALLGAVVLFVYTPKWFLGPDYISQQFHFTVAAFLCFYHYYTHGFRRPWLVVLGAVCACFSFLAFPQSALAAAVIFIGMVLLGRRGKEPTICKIHRGAVLFVLGCMACAAAFLAYVLPGMGLTVFLQRVSLILNDPQYDFTTSQRLALLASQALNTAKFLAKPLAASVVLCLLWWAKTRQKRDWIGLALNLWAILAALLCAVRAVADSSSDERYFMPALVLAAAWAFRKGRGTAREPLFWLGFLPGMAAYAFILRSTLLGFSATFMYLTWPALCGCFAMLARRQVEPEQEKLPQGQCVLAALLVFLLVCRFWCVLVTGWKPANVATANLKQITAGPAAGTWADEKAADMQMALYEALEPFAGKQVLQAIGEQHGLGFMMAGGTLTIGQASVISGTDSDPRFIQYYEELPEKRPDVILYDEVEVRDMAAFHAWIEENFTITARYPVTHGTAHLQVLVVD
ncbi:MAG: hypothetical protein ACLTC5_04790 [Subdoligranulum sp.]